MIFVRVLQAVKCAVRHELAAGVRRICTAISQAANYPLSGTVQLCDRLPILAIETYPVGIDFGNVTVIKIHYTPKANLFR